MAFRPLGYLWLQLGILQSLEEQPSTSITDISKRISSLRTLVDSFGEGLPKYDRGRYASVGGMGQKKRTQSGILVDILPVANNRA